MKQRKIFAIALCSVVLFSLTACTPDPTDPVTPIDPVDPSAPVYDVFWHEGDASENEKFRALTARFFHDSFENDMLNLHFTVKDLEAYGFTRPEMDLLCDGLEEEYYVAFLKELEAVDYGKLSRENQITYDIVQSDLETMLEEESLNPLRSAFDYTSGWQTQLPTVLSEYEFFVEQDICDYLVLLDQIPALFEGLVEYESERVDAGFGLSDAVLDDVSQQFADIYSEGENSWLISTFDDRIDEADFLTDAEKASYRTQNREAILSTVLPAYESTQSALGAFYGKGTNDGGLCGYDGGKAYYEALVLSKCGYDGTVDELYEDLNAHMDQWLNELQTCLQQMIYDKNAGASAYYILLDFLYEGKNSIGAKTDPEEILSYFSSHLDGYFPEIVGTTYSVKYLSEAVAATMPNTLAYYLIPQIDNYQNGSITINGYASSATEMMSTVAHEGYPGHLYQNVYFMSQNPDPVRSLFSFSGYAEGWAVYAQNVAEDIYQYPKYNKYYTPILQYNTSYNYAMYAVMDIGINYYGWTIADVADYLGYDLNTPEEREVIESLTLSLIEMPGVYLSYGVGNMEMLDLRARAEELAGAEFDLVEYHKFVLDVGPCNFERLFALLEEYYSF